MSDKKSVKLSVKCPILGFEDTKELEFFPVDEIFNKVKSLDGKEFEFALIDSQLIRPGYDFAIPTYYQELLGLNENSNKQAFIIVAVHKNQEDTTLNFLAPLLINWDNNSVAQVILEPAAYPDYFQADKITNYIKKD